MVVVKSTTAMVKSDTEDMDSHGLTTTLMVDHDPYELIPTMVNLPQPLSDC